MRARHAQLHRLWRVDEINSAKNGLPYEKIDVVAISFTVARRLLGIGRRPTRSMKRVKIQYHDTDNELCSIYRDNNYAGLEDLLRAYYETHI